MVRRLLCLPIFLMSVSGQTAPEKNPLAEFSRSVRTLTDRVSPAVVQILVNSYGPVEDDEGQHVALFSKQRSSGSGVIVDPEGYIITNAHVVKSAVRVRVVINSRRYMEAPADAKILGIDPETDLAVIKVEKTNLAAMPFGNSGNLRQGDIVLALGSPLGLKNSVSMGVVSAPARQISEDNPVPYIQTDASINPGNSGGALVSVEGRLMGINSFIFTQSGGSQGLGFAIPSNIVRNVYNQLRKQGHVHRGMIGAYVQDITPMLASGLKLPRHAGVMVTDVLPDGPAGQAGLKPKDIILALDGRRIEYARDFELVFYRRQKGDTITVRVLRDGVELPKPLRIQVDEEEDMGDQIAGNVNVENNLVPRLGILCVEIDERLAKMVSDLRQASGLVVAAKAPEGQGRYLDLQPGDVIHGMNDDEVRSLEAFRKNVLALKTGDPVALLIERNGTLRYITFEME